MSDSDSPLMLLRLYIAAEAPNSIRARRNLDIVCQKYLAPESYAIEIIDVLKDGRRALEDHILLTPTLLKLSPSPVTKLTGDLSDLVRVLVMLGIEGDPG
jgi:circadian clock protein KaiB